MPMCPSVLCPDCQLKTYHRGVCENVRCGYDPRNARVNSSPTRQDFQRCGLHVNHAVRPFVRVTAYSPKLMDVDQVQSLLEIDSPVWSQESVDTLGPLRLYGFDLVGPEASRLMKNVDW